MSSVLINNRKFCGQVQIAALGIIEAPEHAAEMTHSRVKTNPLVFTVYIVCICVCGCTCTLCSLTVAHGSFCKLRLVYYAVIMHSCCHK